MRSLRRNPRKDEPRLANELCISLELNRHRPQQKCRDALPVLVEEVITLPKESTNRTAPAGTLLGAPASTDHPN